jgi:hypothetical protein
LQLSPDAIAAPTLFTLDSEATPVRALAVIVEGEVIGNVIDAGDCAFVWSSADILGFADRNAAAIAVLERWRARS